MRRGLMGGTFDPIHMGHLIAADAARSALQLDTVWFLPAGLPWMKQGQTVSAGHHRQAMAELAVASNPDFSILGLELERSGETYTVDTLEAVSQRKGPGDETFFILGSDSLSSLHEWKEPGRILELATLAAVLRPGCKDLNVEELERVVSGASRRVLRVNMPLIDISGTDIRQRVARGLSIRYLVPDPVAEYIEAQGLYRIKADSSRTQNGRGREG